MIADWDGWPWIIAAGASPLALAMYRIERGIRRAVLQIGNALYPILRSIGNLLTS